MNPFFLNIQQFLQRLSLGQKMAVSLVLVGGIGIFAGIAYWAGQPDYALLFGNLDPEDASKVVEALHSDGVTYQLKENGAAVYVPREDVYELRLRFAGEGVVSDGPVGYELFDRGTLGMTDFMQKLNLKRALEGELARTITNVRQVEVARVHLVMPERSPFREAETQPTASVVLKIAGGSRLTTEQIDGITQLVAGAVEGLASADVTVLDTRGNLLSDPSEGDTDAAISSTQLGYQRSVENHLMEKGQSMLDQIVGAGNAIVRVSANIDFSRRVSESNVIDPESATVIAEESMDQNDGEDTANSSIRNYELSRTVERTESSTGQISYLTVSVIVNARVADPTDGGAGAEADVEEVAAETPEQPIFTENDLVEIEALVKNAVGFSAERGDQFAIHQTSFDTSFDLQIAEEIQSHERDRQMQNYLRYGLMALALLAALWLLRSATKTVLRAGDDQHALGGSPADRLEQGRGGSGQREIEGHEEDEVEAVLVDDFYTSRLSPEAKARLKAKHLMYEEVKKNVTETPSDTADLLRAWLLEDHSAV